MSTNWKTFNPSMAQFSSEEAKAEYLERTRCGVCHEKLQEGDEFDLRGIQTPEESGSHTVKAVIVHRKCIER